MALSLSSRGSKLCVPGVMLWPASPFCRLCLMACKHSPKKTKKTTTKDSLENKGMAPPGILDFQARLTIEAHRINIVITELITRLITLAISEPRALWGLFYLRRPSHQCVARERASTRGAQRPAERSLTRSAVCNPPGGTVRLRRVADLLELVVRRSEFTCAYSRCFGDWHLLLREVDCCDPKRRAALVTERRTFKRRWLDWVEAGPAASPTLS